jgi:molybdopterin converting factor small subunit
MRIKVRAIGALRSALGTGSLDVNAPDGSDLASLIQVISEGRSELAENLSDALRFSLILVNGVEVGNLNGLKTVLIDDSEVIFVPVTHGG